MRSSDDGYVISGQLEVETPNARVSLRRFFPPDFEPKVIVNRRMLLPTKKPRATSIR